MERDFINVLSILTTVFLYLCFYYVKQMVALEKIMFSCNITAITEFCGRLVNFWRKTCFFCTEEYKFESLWQGQSNVHSAITT